VSLGNRKSFDNVLDNCDTRINLADSSKRFVNAWANDIEQFHPLSKLSELIAVKSILAKDNDLKRQMFFSTTYVVWDPSLPVSCEKIVTKLGGSPSRPSSEPWPKAKNGRPLTFVCQFAVDTAMKRAGVKGDVLLLFAPEYDRTKIIRRLNDDREIDEIFVVFGMDLVVETWYLLEIDEQWDEPKSVITIASEEIIGVEVESTDYILGFDDEILDERDVMRYAIGNIPITKICIGYWGANGQRFCSEAKAEFDPDLPLLQVTGFESVSRHFDQLKDVYDACGEKISGRVVSPFVFGDGFTAVVFLTPDGILKTTYFT
jgi:hypothetical protein